MGDLSNLMHPVHLFLHLLALSFRAGLLRERSRNNCGHGTKFGDFPTVCGHFLASKAGKDAIVAWPQKTVFFFGAKCVGWANLCQTVGFDEW